MDSSQHLDFDHIRNHYSLYEYMVESLGEPVSKNTWRCIFHNEHHRPGRDLKYFVGEDGIPRFQCQSAKCGEKGDVIDFVRLYGKFPDNLTAARHLTGKMPQVQESWAKQIPPKKSPKNYNDLIPVVKQYHTAMNGESKYWNEQGITDSTIKHFQLGYCSRCPSYYDKNNPQDTRESLTTPYFYKNDLVDIKHRLLGEEKDKYRHHKKGMRNKLFYPQGLFSPQNEIPFYLSNDKEALILEGETKTMFFWQMGWSCTGLPGANKWSETWLRFFKHLDKVYICLDPNVEEKTLLRIAYSLKSVNVLPVIVNLPTKPDDMFVLFGGTVDEFQYYLSFGRVL